MFLRPEWVFEVAHSVEVFVRAVRDEPGRPVLLDRFFDSLPVPQRELEHQLLQELRRRLATLATRHDPSPAERARQLLLEDYRRPWTLDALAHAVGCNRTTLQEGFRSLTRTSVHQFLVRHRVDVAKRLLTAPDVKVSRIAVEVGYRSQSAFARHFKTLTGSTLTTYRVRQNGTADRERVSAERAPSLR